MGRFVTSRRYRSLRYIAFRAAQFAIVAGPAAAGGITIGAGTVVAAVALIGTAFVAGIVITAAGRVDEGATTSGTIATIATALLPDQRRPHPVRVGPRIATRREQSTAKIDMYSAAATRPVRAGQSQALLRRPVRAAGRCRLPAVFPPEPEPVRAGRDGRDE
jgi:hypothetical protein